MPHTSKFEAPPFLPDDDTVAALVIHVDEVASTNDTARDLVASPAFDIPHLTTVLARNQTNGRGRLGRSWSTLPDRSLTASTVVRLPATPGVLDALPWVLICHALATRAALAQRLRPLGHLTGVKWPNDVVVDTDRKIAGLLAEIVCVDADEAVLVLGCGVNVSMRPGERPTPAATALSLEGDTPSTAHPRRIIDSLLAAQLKGLDARLEALVHADGNAARAGVLKEFRTHCATLGRPVVVRDPRDPGPRLPTRDLGPVARARTGLARDIGSDAALLVETPDGTVHRIRAGDVDLVGSAPQSTPARAQPLSST